MFPHELQHIAGGCPQGSDQVEAYSVTVLVVQIILCAVLVVIGGAALVIGWRGLRGQLPRNRYAGVRTAATMRDDSAFELGNRVAAPATLAGGAASLLCGLALLALPSLSAVIIVALLGGVGLVVLMGIGGTLGHRAAAALPEPVAAGGCGGCAGGCCG